MESGRSYDKKRQKTVRIQSQSPYEILDSVFESRLTQIKAMWPLCKKCDVIIKLTMDFFSNSKNPYIDALKAMTLSGDFYTGKQNSLAYNLMDSFSVWIKPRESILAHLLTKNIKYDAFNLVIKQKNQALVSLVATIYKMLDNKEIFVKSIEHLIQTGNYKEACQYAVMLQLHSFKLEDFVIPLIFQDKYSVAEKFLKNNKQLQLETAQFLDNLLGKDNIKAEAEYIIRSLKIADCKTSHLHYKPLSKLVGRVLKTFNLPLSTCPNLMKKKGKGALQFLINKRYIEKTISGESWAEMALEAIGEDENLQAELVEKVAIFGDLKEALHWAERFGIPEESWPYRLREFKKRIKNVNAHILNEQSEEYWDEKAEEKASNLNFHQLPIAESQIIMIDTTLNFSNFLNDVNQEVTIIGLDAEWKPSFGFKKCDLALIQVATNNRVYILDVMVLGPEAPEVLWMQFSDNILSNPNIIKLGFGINGDVAIMKEALWKFHEIIPSEAGLLDLGILWKTLVENYNFVFPYSLSDYSASESLNSLIELCFGEKLDKSDQFSNWENRPLRKSQIIYAALDAYCLLEAYNVMVSESDSQKIPINEVVNEILNDVISKNSTKKKKIEKCLTYEENGVNNSSKSKKTVSEFRVLCDGMLTGLGKQLRKCGIDTIILERGEEPPVKIIAGSVPLTVITQRKNFGFFKKYGYVYCVKSTRLKDQVFEVLNYFNVDVTEGDVYSRCLVCNSNEFDTFTQEKMKQLANNQRTFSHLLPAEEFVDEYSADFFDDDAYEFEDDEDWSSNSQKWSSCQKPLDDYFSNRTRMGALIGISAVPQGVLRKVSTFYICTHCGKCYWEGSHKERGLGGFMGKIINR